VDYGGPEIPSDTTPRDHALLCRDQLVYWSGELIRSITVNPPAIRIEPRLQTKQADVYAFGTLLYEMYACAYSYIEHPLETIIYLVGSGERQSVDKVHASIATRQLIVDCWSHDPIYRPTFADILRDLQHTSCSPKQNSSSEPEAMHKAGRMPVAFDIHRH